MPTPPAAPPTPPAAAQLTNPYAAMKPWPASANELLTNLKLAIDNDWLLQPAFYAEWNLREFFGTMEKVWLDPTPPEYPGFGINSKKALSAHAPLPEAQRVGVSYFDQSNITVRGGLRRGTSGNLRGGIGLSMGNQVVRFHETEGLFGTRWKFNPPGPPPGHYIPPPITHPLGLKYILFDLSTTTRKITIQQYLHGDGSIQSFSINIEEK